MRRAVKPVRVAAIESLDLERNRDLDAEFERLVEGARGQGEPGDAGRKAEIVLDSRRGPRLAAERFGIEHEHRQAFRRRIDGGSEPGGPSADHGHVVNLAGIELRRDAEANSGFSLGRAFQHRAVRAYHQRQLGRQHTETLDHGAAVRVLGGIEHGVGIAVAPEEILDPRELSGSRVADQHRAYAATLRLQQSDPA